MVYRRDEERDWLIPDNAVANTITPMEFIEAMMADVERLKKVAKVIKKHFTNLTVEQTIDIAAEVLQAADHRDFPGPGTLSGGKLDSSG